MQNVITHHIVPAIAGLASVPVLEAVAPSSATPLQVSVALVVAFLVRWAEMRFLGIPPQSRRRRTTYARARLVERPKRRTTKGRKQQK